MKLVQTIPQEACMRDGAHVNIITMLGKIMISQ